MTWNINSVRLRAHLVIKAAQMLSADVICLQETKTPDEHFPHEIFHEAGYHYRHICGMKSYNGVAILSRVPFTNPSIHARVARDDCRHIAVCFENFDLHNIYIPAGGDVPDRDINPKFAHKLDFVDEMAAWFKDRYTPQCPVIAVGDFNIAPCEHDVWSHKQLLQVVSHTPIEVEGLTRMQGSLSWIDTARHFIPEPTKVYTWWSYRNRDWLASNRGRRLDHIWVTPALQGALQSHDILVEARNWEQTSDHVPVVIALTPS